jgi:hypothetical protein
MKAASPLEENMQARHRLLSLVAAFALLGMEIDTEGSSD